tara:strand:- start:322 stop:1335 length:1014 start_codon:yes stop_codon:yes gene_type:complete
MNCSLFENENEVNTDGIWAESGLQDIHINTLKYDTGDFLVTTEAGVYKKEASEFNSIGLTQFDVGDIVKLEEGAFISVIPSVSPEGTRDGDTTIYKTEDNGETWFPFMNNFGGEGEYSFVEKISVDRTNRNNLFARKSTAVIISRDQGVIWEPRNGPWDAIGGLAGFMYIDPFHENMLWAGGASGLSGPYIFKSEDYGETWDFIEAIGDLSAPGGISWDLLTSPKSRNIAMVGMNGLIRRTTNGGDTWNEVFRGRRAIYTMERSPRNPNRIYATGFKDEGTLFFMASNNFGDSWTFVEFKDGPTELYTSDLVAVMENGKEVLYFGTTKGVYSFTFEK